MLYNGYCIAGETKHTNEISADAFQGDRPRSISADLPYALSNTRTRG